MAPEDCTNPSQPCHLHDARNEWRIEIGRQSTIDARWLLLVAAIAIGLSTLDWFANLPT